MRISVTGGFVHEGKILKPEARRWRTYALIDLLPPGKMTAVRSLLEVTTDDDDVDEITEADPRAIQAGLDSAEWRGTVSMEEVLYGRIAIQNL